jgi:hypothetical protein
VTRELAFTHIPDPSGVFLVTPRVFGNCMNAVMSGFPIITLLSLSLQGPRLQVSPHPLSPPPTPHPHLNPRHPAPVRTNNDPQLTLCPGPPACECYALQAYGRRTPLGPGPVFLPRRTCRGLRVAGLLPLPGSTTHLSLLRREARNSLRSCRRGAKRKGKKKKKKGNTQFVVFSWGLFSCQKNYPLCLCAKEAVRAPSAGRRHGANAPCLRAASVPFLASPDIFLTYKTLYLIGYRSPFS